MIFIMQEILLHSIVTSVARNIRISDAKQFEVADIVDLSDAFMHDWMKKMKGEAPSAEVLSSVKIK